MRTISKSLVSTKWLYENLAHCKVIDASWFLPSQKRDPKREFLACRIPSAKFFDVEEVACPNAKDLPHMMPTTEIFQRAMDEFGIRPTDNIVVYDSIGIFSAARVWYTFKCFGATNVFVLDGGLPKWMFEDKPLKTDDADADVSLIETPDVGTRTYKEKTSSDSWNLDTSMVWDAEKVLDRHLNTKTCIIVDARSYGRFIGVEAEPRSALIPGHIPLSKSLPFTSLLKTVSSADESIGTSNHSRSSMDVKNSYKWTTYVSPDEIISQFEKAGINIKQFLLRGDSNVDIVFTCGSGMTACILALGVDLVRQHLLLSSCHDDNDVMKVDQVAIYDGSWCEWGKPANKDSFPISVDTTSSS